MSAWAALKCVSPVVEGLSVVGPLLPTVPSVVVVGIVVSFEVSAVVAVEVVVVSLEVSVVVVAGVVVVSLVVSAVGSVIAGYRVSPSQRDNSSSSPDFFF